MKERICINYIRNIFSFITILLLVSCELKPNCEHLQSINKTVECYAVIVSKPTHSNVFIKKAYNPITNKECNCEDKDRWMRLYYKEMDIGDTIIKKYGDLFFEIHKIDTIIVHNWYCNDKLYK